MKNKLKKWEVEYQKYDKNEADKKIQELEAKMEDKTITKEEYQELNRQKKLRNNIDKVANIVELRDKLLKEQNEIKVELKRREDLSNASNESIKIEDELKQIEEQIEKTNKELKKSDLKEEEKGKLQTELTELNKKRNENNKKYIKNQSDLLNNKDFKNEKFANISKEDLDKEVFELGTKISKCNIVANNLMNGLSWDSIEVKLETYKDRKFTSEEKITEKVKNDNYNIEEMAENIVKETTKILNSDQEKNEAIEENALVEQSNFETKHPRLAKMINFMKTKWNNIFKKNENVVEEVKPDMEQENKENVEQEEKEEVEKSQRDEFIQYLKDVSEKGMDAVNKEKNTSKAKETFKENKKKAYERESEKFGKEYAEKSYKEDSENEL